ncbi:fungal-specific transcription factor domain-containing protein [Thelonectria olida]|uniref:Fungal-specific transcription factor domain-containing protein n=1 Tax=Thelonectria olida TaxID=1576542 RepID=A0A9P8W0Y1_9HYPO|nr:fungal-specific transcription factor domain-containing protein [Thelonectria olida]
MGTTSKAAPVRCRAAKACKACHDRRVKCDAVERGTPCTRCEQYGISACSLIKSKRGTYPRNRARPDKARDQTLASVSRDGGELVSGSALAEEASRAREAQRPVDASRVGSMVPEESDSLTQDAMGMGREIQANGHDSAQAVPEVPTQSPTCPSNVPDPKNVTQAAMLDPTPRGPSPYEVAGQDLSSPDSDVSRSVASSYREISWPTMFDHFLDTRRRDRKSLIDKCSITYLGESFPLAMVLEDLEDGGSIKLHYPGPPMPEPAPQRDHLLAEQHPAHMHDEEIRNLTTKGAFEYPRTEILDGLITAFLSRVYPLYPIVNRPEFLTQVSSKTMPWLLMHSVCFIASTFCPISILHQASFSNRKEARYNYYSRAKALFDAGYEVNKIVTLQSTILLAFWAGGPNDFWNCYSWNSTSVTIAEALGLHRSMARANINPQDRSLLRRLWWTLVVRDASCGALFGRPFRINMDFCDTEMLTMDDFKADSESPEFAGNPLMPTYSLYQIHVARLSLILRSIIASRFAQRNQVQSDPMSRLQLWLQELPTSLRWDAVGQTPNVFSWCLSILYDHHVILCMLGHLSPDNHSRGMDAATSPPFQGRFGSLSRVSPGALRDGEGCASTIDSAAQRILSLACGIVRRSATLNLPHEAYPGLFLAEVVFYTQMKSSSPSRAQLGQSSMMMCQMAWHNISDAWDSAPWVMRLFDNLISNMQNDVQGPSLDDGGQCADPNPNTTETHAGVSRMPGLAMAGGMPDELVPDMPELDTGFIQDSWHTHPMLSSFLETNLNWASPWGPPEDPNMGPNFLNSDVVDQQLRLLCPVALSDMLQKIGYMTVDACYVDGYLGPRLSDGVESTISPRSPAASSGF